MLPAYLQGEGLEGAQGAEHCQVPALKLLARVVKQQHKLLQIAQPCT